MNRESSRSHCVFTCVIESTWEKDSTTNYRFARLNLVDLAGSERYDIILQIDWTKYSLRYACTCTHQIIIIYYRQKTSGAEGERLKEAANINKSLSTLGYFFPLIDTDNDFCVWIILPYFCFLIMQLMVSDLACSHVIMILVDVANGKQRHIPYRDSRLTFLLQVVDYLLVSFDIFILMMSFIHH
jgi:kinesin family protein 15